MCGSNSSGMPFRSQIFKKYEVHFWTMASQRMKLLTSRVLNLILQSHPTQSIEKKCTKFIGAIIRKVLGVLVVGSVR